MTMKTCASSMATTILRFVPCLILKSRFLMISLSIYLRTSSIWAFAMVPLRFARRLWKLKTVKFSSVVMVDGLMRNGANLVTAIGEAYVKIAGGGAQAETVLTSAKKIYSYFTSKGGDPAKATVTTEDGKVKVTDGTTCVSCDKDGNCAECTDCTVTDGAVTGQDGVK